MEMLAVRHSYSAAFGFIDLYNKQELIFSLFLFCIVIIECRYDVYWACASIISQYKRNFFMISGNCYWTVKR
jgi:hypothetical protein